ncbi:MAG TPA: DUF2442 domain-containing protein [Bacillales bacterium]|nr:DUF2442 domain-containing protein [Bacillales bacterium]
MREICKVKPLPLSGWLLIEFDNGEKGLVDIRPSMNGVLNILKDEKVFSQVYVDEDAGTVAWPNELHIDPDTLYERRISINEIKYLAKLMDDQLFDKLDLA